MDRKIIPVGVRKRNCIGNWARRQSRGGKRARAATRASTQPQCNNNNDDRTNNREDHDDGVTASIIKPRPRDNRISSGERGGVGGRAGRSVERDDDSMRHTRE